MRGSDMRRLFRRQDAVERALRRAQPNDELVQQIVERVHVETRARRRRRSFRLAAPVLLTAVAAGALCAVGAASYAATQVESTVNQVFSLDASTHVSVATSGADQY